MRDWYFSCENIMTICCVIAPMELNFIMVSEASKRPLAVLARIELFWTKREAVKMGGCQLGWP